MSMPIEQLTVELLGLPTQHRALLAEKLISSLDDTTMPDTEALWIKEKHLQHDAEITI